MGGQKYHVPFAISTKGTVPLALEQKVPYSSELEQNVLYLAALAEKVPYLSALAWANAFVLKSSPNTTDLTGVAKLSFCGAGVGWGGDGGLG